MTLPPKKISFSYRLLTASGLESTLKRELESIAPHLKSALSISRGSVQIRSELFDRFDVASNFMDEFVSDVVLRSRVLNGVRIGLGEAFTAKWEQQASEAMRGLPWKMFYHKASPVPEVFVKSKSSRLFVPSHVRSLVEDAFKEYQGQSVFQQLQHRPIGASSEAASPRIFVQVEQDRFQFEVDAGGKMLNNFGLDRYNCDSRLDLAENSSAAIAIRSLPRLIDGFTEPTIVWDPFCGGGQLILTAARALSGIPAGSPAIDYCFKSFPVHSPIVFASKVNALRLEPHKNGSSISRFYATDSSPEAVEVMRRNLATFNAGLPEQSNGTGIMPFEIQVDRLPEAYTPPPVGKVCILTALPSKGDTERKYKKFHSLVDHLDKENRLAGCVAATSKSNMFRKLSSRRWLTELRFFDGRREVEVLSLV